MFTTLRNLYKNGVPIVLIFTSVPVLMPKVKKFPNALVTSNSVDG